MRHTLILGATALFAASIASAQSSTLPDPTSPVQTEDRATQSETRDTMPERNNPKTKSTFNAVEAAGGTLSDKDATFVKKAASIGLEEVEAGKLAADHAGDAQVKSFAEQMVTDHGQNNDELKSIVEKKGITLPTEPQGKQATAVASLKSKNGADFDKAFVDENVKGHKEAIELFTTASKSAKDPEIKSYAAKTLPTLKHHLEMAQSVQKSMTGSGVSGKTSKSKKESVPATDTSGGG